MVALPPEAPGQGAGPPDRPARHGELSAEGPTVAGLTLPALMSQALTSGLKPPHTKRLWSFGWNFTAVTRKSLCPLNVWAPVAREEQRENTQVTTQTP